jgi:hypothetical protein
MYAQESGLAIDGKDMYLRGGKRAPGTGLRTSDCGAPGFVVWGGHSCPPLLKLLLGLVFGMSFFYGRADPEAPLTVIR